MDVNVHPTKSEVRFRDERRLFGFLVNTLREGLARTDMSTPGERMLAGRTLTLGDSLPQAYLPNPGPDAPSASGADGQNRTATGAGGDDFAVYEVPAREAQVAADESGAAWAARDAFAGPYLRVASTYILRSLPDGFEIVDQHALHERVTFERLKSQLAASGVEVQRLLVPECVELSRAEVRTLEGHLEALESIGVYLGLFGETTISVQGVPALLRRVDAEELVRDLIAMLERLDRTPPAAELLEEVLHSMACRSSVMGGDQLGDTEIEELLRSAEAAGGAQTCPHGRPTRVRFGLADLEKAFHRR